MLSGAPLIYSLGRMESTTNVSGLFVVRDNKDLHERNQETKGDNNNNDRKTYVTRPQK